MFTRPEGRDFFVNLRPTMLDDPSWFTPFIETSTSEKLPWATTPAVHSFAAGFRSTRTADGRIRGDGRAATA
jgi:hypothetical protein